MRNKKQKVFSL